VCFADSDCGHYALIGRTWHVLIDYFSEWRIVTWHSEGERGGKIRVRVSDCVEERR